MAKRTMLWQGLNRSCSRIEDVISSNGRSFAGSAFRFTRLGTAFMFDGFAFARNVGVGRKEYFPNGGVERIGGLVGRLHDISLSSYGFGS